MGTNNLETKNDGDVIEAADPNQFKSAFVDNVVPRDATGVPVDQGGSLGTTLFSWLQAFIRKVFFGDPLANNYITSDGANLKFYISNVLRATIDATGLLNSSLASNKQWKKLTVIANGAHALPADVNFFYAFGCGSGAGGGGGGGDADYGDNPGGGGGAGGCGINPGEMWQKCTGGITLTFVVPAGGAGGAGSNSAGGSAGSAGAALTITGTGVSIAFPGAATGGAGGSAGGTGSGNGAAAPTPAESTTVGGFKDIPGSAGANGGNGSGDVGFSSSGPTIRSRCAVGGAGAAGGLGNGGTAGGGGGGGGGAGLGTGGAGGIGVRGVTNPDSTNNGGAAGYGAGGGGGGGSGGSTTTPAARGGGDGSAGGGAYCEIWCFTAETWGD